MEFPICTFSKFPSVRINKMLALALPENRVLLWLYFFAWDSSSAVHWIELSAASEMSMIKFALIGQSFNHQRISRAVGNIGFWWKPATCGSPPSLRPSLPSSLLDMSAVNLSECAAHRGSPYLSQGGDVILWCEAFSSTGVTWLQHASLFFFLMFFFSYPDVQSLIPDALSHLSLPLVRFFPLCLADCLSFTSLFFPFFLSFFVVENDQFVHWIAPFFHLSLWHPHTNIVVGQVGCWKFASVVRDAASLCRRAAMCRAQP